MILSVHLAIIEQGLLSLKLYLHIFLLITQKKLFMNAKFILLKLFLSIVDIFRINCNLVVRLSICLCNISHLPVKALLKSVKPFQRLGGANGLTKLQKMIFLCLSRLCFHTHVVKSC